jgi:hypothetical protein
MDELQEAALVVDADSIARSLQRIAHVLDGIHRQLQIANGEGNQ